MATRSAAAGMLAIAVLWSATCTAAEPAGSWEHSVALGLNLTRGNSDTTLGNLAVKSAAATERTVVTLGLEGTYGKSRVEEDGVSLARTTAQNAKASANGKRMWDRRYAYLDGTLAHDRIADVAYRMIVGPGAGYIVWQSDGMKLACEAGAGYLWEEVGDVRDHYPAFRFLERWDWRITDTSASWQEIEYLPRADRFGEYLMRAEAGVEAALNARVNLRCVLQAKYDSEPAEDQEREDVSLVAALAWKWKR